MEKVRVRFGIKTGSWIFPNAAVFVIRLDPVRFGELLAIVEQLKSVLPEHWGGRIVCEES